MGGGGGGGRTYIRDIAPNKDDCDKIYFITDLQNVQPCISDYKVGDILDVRLDVSGRIYAEGEHGICGYITAVSISQLVKCLEKGKDFQATIQSISGVNCRVEVKPN